MFYVHIKFTTQGISINISEKSPADRNASPSNHVVKQGFALTMCALGTLISIADPFALPLV